MSAIIKFEDPLLAGGKETCKRSIFGLRRREASEGF